MRAGREGGAPRAPIHSIRALHWRGFSERAIPRMRGINRCKCADLAEEVIEPERRMRQQTPRPSPEMDPRQEIVAGRVEADRSVLRKQRRTARRAHLELVRVYGADVLEVTVRPRLTPSRNRTTFRGSGFWRTPRQSSTRRNPARAPGGGAACARCSRRSQLAPTASCASPYTRVSGAAASVCSASTASRARAQAEGRIARCRDAFLAARPGAYRQFVEIPRFRRRSACRRLVAPCRRLSRPRDQPDSRGGPLRPRTAAAARRARGRIDP